MSTSDDQLDISIESPAVGVLEQVNAPGLSTGVTPSLQPVIGLPESELGVVGDETHISVGHPFPISRTSGPLRLRVTMTGSGDYAVSVALLADQRVDEFDYTFHTSHADRGLLLTWDQSTRSSSVEVGATPPLAVSAAPSGEETQVNWQAVSGATGYRVFRRRDAFPSFDLVATVDANTVQWLAIDDPWSGAVGMPPAQFAVSALVGAEESAFSVVVTNTDQDGDGLSDVEEAALGTNPLLPDSEGDGLSDRLEVEIGPGAMGAVGASPPTVARPRPNR